MGGPVGRAPDQRSGAFRDLPRAGRRHVVAVTAAAVVVGSAATAADGFAGFRPAVMLLLAVGSGLHTEIVRRAESGHGDVDRRPQVDLKSMWGFAAVLLEPVGVALALMLVMAGYATVRSSHRHPPAAAVLATAAAVLSAAVAGFVLDLAVPGPDHDALRGDRGVSALLVVGAATLLRGSIALAAVEVGPRLGRTAARRPPPVRWADIRLSFGGLALGVVLAALVVNLPWLVPVLVVPAFAVHRGALLAHLARSAQSDGKTGVLSASHWHRVARAALDRAHRHGSTLAVLMVDLDEFKLVNDRYGHLAGDGVLRAVADEIADEVRVQDAVGRFGGEEFVVLLRGPGRDGTTAAVAAGTTAERIRARVAALTVALPAAEGGPSPGSVGDLSVSVGVAVHPGGARDLEELLRAADSALYAAKRAGRDQVQHAPAADPEPA